MDFSTVTKVYTEHPVIATLATLIGGYFVLSAIGLIGTGGGNGGGGSGGDTAAVAAYYSAQSAQAQSGNQLQEAQILAQAATAQTLIKTNADVANQTTWAATQLALQQDNNQTAMSLAPYSVEEELVSTLGHIASLPPTTATSTKSSQLFGGLFGPDIGKSSKTTTTVTPNPNAASAAQLLASLSDNLWPGH
jgi:hypothetical protein